MYNPVSSIMTNVGICVCTGICVFVRACVRACVRVCGSSILGLLPQSGRRECLTAVLSPAVSWSPPGCWPAPPGPATGACLTLIGRSVRGKGGTVVVGPPDRDLQHRRQEQVSPPLNPEHREHRGGCGPSRSHRQGDGGGTNVEKCFDTCVILELLYMLCLFNLAE